MSLSLAPISHDFDFLFGRYHVVNRRLVTRLAGCTEWEIFHATNEARPILGGLGNTDEFRAEGWRPGFIGSTLRLFNPTTGLWSIYWADNQHGTLEPPVLGKFNDGVGLFEGDDTFNGQLIRVRFTWTRPTPLSARWEQAFSADNRLTWETNWTMDFARA